MVGETAVKQINALTVDVEDYFHVSAFADTINPRDWDRHECRVERNTRELLTLFGEHGMRATFFVLGWVAERYPGLVREIARHGHEVACHGLTHELVYRQTPSVFRSQTERAKSLLEDIVQIPVLGYRAASYSIVPASSWALEMLAELGFQYDSSIFPVRHDRYGFPGAPREPHRIALSSGRSLVEFPLTTWRRLGVNLPVSGGGYFRLFPYFLTRHALRHVNEREGLPAIFYLHPWEIDPDQPRVPASLLSRFRHYNNLHRCRSRLTALLGDFSFDTAKSVLERQGLLAPASGNRSGESGDIPAPIAAAAQA
jgi:polysaccharide deacetylase family protein (PEP-CTERM system associated)